MSFVDGAKSAFSSAMQELRSRAGRKQPSGPIAIFEPLVLGTFRLWVNGKEEDGVMFQYNPTSIRVNKNINYANKDVPGLSDPLQLFVNGGKQNITIPFTVSDIGANVCPTEEGPTLPESFLGWIASKMAPTQQDPLMSQIPPKLILAAGNKVWPVRIDTLDYEVTRFWPDLRYREVKGTLTVFVAIHQNRGPADLMQTI